MLKKDLYGDTHGNGDGDTNEVGNVNTKASKFFSFFYNKVEIDLFSTNFFIDVYFLFMSI